MRTRLIIGVVTIFGIFLISQLSPTHQTIAPGVKANSELVESADFDFLALSERLWEEGDKQGAVVALNIAIENGIGDNNANVQKILRYKNEIIQDQTLFGRIKSLGTGVTTEPGASPDNSLKGQLWQEFGIYGKNIVMEPNSVGDNLSTLNEMGTIFPKASENFTVFKLLLQSGALTGNMEKNVAQVIEPLQNVTASSSNITKITQSKNVVDQLNPIKELIDNSYSWYQVKIFLASCSSFKQVRELTKIIATGNNGIKMEQLITVLGQRKKNIRETVNYIQIYGQRGLNNIYASISKGAKGLQFVLEHPTLVVNLNTATQVSSNAFEPVKAKLASLKETHGSVYEVAKNFVIALLLFICIISWIPKKLFLQVDNSTVQNYVSKNYLFIVTSVCAIIFLILLTNQFLSTSPAPVAPSLLDSTTSGTMSAAQGTNTVTPQVAKSAVKTAVLSPISWAVMLVFLILHAIVGSNTKGKIFRLAEEKKSPSIKLGLLKNIEHDLDLSVYIGLAGTVTSFIIMQFDPSGSRILAYSSTLAGIIISCVLKTLYYQPLLNKLIAGKEAGKVVLTKQEGEINE